MATYDKAKVYRAWWLLRLVYGIVPIAVGIDKLFATNIIAGWAGYVSPMVHGMLPAAISLVMLNTIVGVVEIIAGVLVLTKTRVGAYLVAAWLVVVVANLASMGMYYDIIARDVALAIGAYALALLSEAGCGC